MGCEERRALPGIKRSVLRGGRRRRVKIAEDPLEAVTRSPPFYPETQANSVRAPAVGPLRPPPLHTLICLHLHHIYTFLRTSFPPLPRSSSSTDFVSNVNTIRTGRASGTVFCLTAFIDAVLKRKQRPARVCAEGFII